MPRKIRQIGSGGRGLQRYGGLTEKGQLSHGLKVGREKALQVCGAEHSRQGAQLEQRSQDAMSLAVGQHRKEVRVAEVPALVGRLRGTQRNSLFNGGKCKAKTGVIREKTIILDPTPPGAMRAESCPPGPLELWSLLPVTVLLFWICLRVICLQDQGPCPAP